MKNNSTLGKVFIKTVLGKPKRRKTDNSHMMKAIGITLEIIVEVDNLPMESP